MHIQIVKKFSKRTEYKVLMDWINVIEKDVEELKAGVCVIPAIVLLKLSDIERRNLNIWWKQWGNQLIVSPPFHQMDIVSLLQLNTSLSVQPIQQQLYLNIPIVEEIKTNAQSKWKLDNGQVIAIDIYDHSGSGCVTLTTIPFLDYRLLSKSEVCKQSFISLLHENSKSEVEKIHSEFEITPVHEYILILSSANIFELERLSLQLKRYFNTELSQVRALEFCEELINNNFMQVSGYLTELGVKYINDKGYKAFVREIKRWRCDDAEW